MKGDTWDRVMRMIHDLGLHDGRAPVDLSALEEIYIPKVVDFDRLGVDGLTMRTDQPHEPCQWWPVGVIVGKAQDEAKQREIYCHEVGHLICGHSGSLHSLDVDDWFHDRDELEATEVASLLLIPLDEWMRGEPAAAVASRCQVDTRIADIYPWPWKIAL